MAVEPDLCPTWSETKRLDKSQMKHAVVHEETKAQIRYMVFAQLIGAFACALY